MAAGAKRILGPGAFKNSSRSSHLGERWRTVFQALHAAARALLPSQFKFPAAACFERRYAEQIDFEDTLGNDLAIRSGNLTHGIYRRRPHRRLYEWTGGVARKPAFRFGVVHQLLQYLPREPPVDDARSQRAFDRCAGNVWTAGSGAECRDK